MNCLGAAFNVIRTLPASRQYQGDLHDIGQESDHLVLSALATIHLSRALQVVNKSKSTARNGNSSKHYCPDRFDCAAIIGCDYI